jgi:hypothetical protein
MHLGIYEFTGNPDDLLPAYDRLMETIPPGNVSWHLCAVRDDGIMILDTCPSEALFQSFSENPAFHEAIAASGLPEPRITGLPVHAARATQSGGA